MQSTPKTRFRLWLPLIFLVLSIGMEVLAMAEMSWIEQSSSASTRRPYRGEGHDDFIVRVRFVDRALNAPAFAAARKMPYVLRVEGWLSGEDSLRFEDDLGYLLFVTFMWFLIGYRLDRWREEKRTGEPGSTFLRRRVVRLLWVVYGVFVCWNVVNYNTYAVSFETWFAASAFGWGVGLIFAGLCPFSPSWRWVWRSFYGILGLLVGGISCWHGVFLFRGERLINLNHSAGISVLVWGTFLIAAGLHLLLGPILHSEIETTSLRATQGIRHQT